MRVATVTDVARPQNVAYTKSVYGVKVDPLSQHRLASFHEVSTCALRMVHWITSVHVYSSITAIVQVCWSMICVYFHFQSHISIWDTRNFEKPVSFSCTNATFFKHTSLLKIFGFKQKKFDLFRFSQDWRINISFLIEFSQISTLTDTKNIVKIAWSPKR